MNVVVVGGGLAGCEVAWQLAERGVSVELREQKPERRTPAQNTDRLAELVCSNSLRGAALSNAVGLLKEEMRRSGSLIMRSADASAVPAGGALAVDREVFAGLVEGALHGHPLVTIVPGEVTAVPTERPCVLATGPLTGDRLAQDLERMVGRDRIAYYDAIAPIVAADSVDPERVFAQSRYGKGQGDEYINCPMNEEQYQAFVAALLAAETAPVRAFEEPRYFEGCLPIEVMASRGPKTLQFGPMKPVGLTDPRTGLRPAAVVQLRAEDRALTAYNLVGFQTRMTWGEQGRVFRTIPGLEHAEFLRFGTVHRNTFLDAPRLLGPRMELVAAPGVYVTGQLAGVEGYVESAGAGLLCGLFLAAALRGGELPLPPPTTAFGGLLEHLRRANTDFQPSNIIWSLVAPLEGTRRSKRERYEAMAERALADHAAWWAAVRDRDESQIVPAKSVGPVG